MNADDYFNTVSQKLEALSDEEFDKLILECTGDEESKKRKKKKKESNYMSELLNRYKRG